MIKVLKTDLFRLIKSKAFYVYPIFILVIVILGNILAAYVKEMEEETDTQGGLTVTVYEEGTETDIVNADIEIKTGKAVTDSEKEKLTVKISTVEFFGNYFNGEILLFLGIVLVIFCTCETRFGFVKNAAGSVSDRGFMPLSKMIIGIVITVIYILEYAAIYASVQLITALISGNKIEYEALPVGDGPKFVEFLLITALVYITFIAMTTALHELTHNRALGIVLAFVFSTTLLEQLLEGLMSLLQRFLGVFEGVEIKKYMLMTNVYDGYLSENYHPGTTIVLSLVYIAVFTFLAVFISKKKEIR